MLKSIDVHSAYSTIFETAKLVYALYHYFAMSFNQQLIVFRKK